MNDLIQSVERRQLRKLPAFREGDRLRVHFQVIEGQRRRTQVFEGVVLKLQGAGSRRTFTVRKLSFGVGVERTFPLHSPKIEQIELMGRGEVRRAKLYYLRGRIGRRARVTERRDLSAEELAEMGPMTIAERAGEEQAATERSGEQVQDQSEPAGGAEVGEPTGGGETTAEPGEQDAPAEEGGEPVAEGAGESGAQRAGSDEA